MGTMGRQTGAGARRAREGAPFLVPFGKDPGFVGRRNDLDQLHLRFRSGAAGLYRAALVGMGGIGKTQLAAEYAHEYG